MFTLVHISSSPKSSRETASLLADYLAFDRQRTSRRQYAKAFGGMALIVILGAVFGRVEWREAQIVGTILLLPPAALVAIEWVHRGRLTRRLDRVRAELQDRRKL
jgi:hypothetical protein